MYLILIFIWVIEIIKTIQVFCLLTNVTQSAVHSSNWTQMILDVCLLVYFHADNTRTLLMFFWKEVFPVGLSLKGKFLLFLLFKINDLLICLVYFCGLVISCFVHLFCFNCRRFAYFLKVSHAILWFMCMEFQRNLYETSKPIRNFESASRTLRMMFANCTVLFVMLEWNLGTVLFVI